MNSRVKFLKTIFILPAIVAALRLLLTAIVFIFNPTDMSLRFIQSFPVIVLLVSLFTYLKLYSDSAPVITLLLPSIAHIIIIFIFTRHLEILPFIPVIILDIFYIIIKGIKATAFPFEIEGEEDEDEFSDLEAEEA